MKVVLLSDFFPHKADSVIKAEVKRRLSGKVGTDYVYAHVHATSVEGVIGITAYDRTTRKGCKFYIKGSQIIEPEEFFEEFFKDQKKSAPEGLLDRDFIDEALDVESRRKTDSLSGPGM